MDYQGTLFPREWRAGDVSAAPFGLAGSGCRASRKDARRRGVRDLFKVGGVTSPTSL